MLFRSIFHLYRNENGAKYEIILEEKNSERNLCRLCEFFLLDNKQKFDGYKFLKDPLIVKSLSSYFRYECFLTDMEGKLSIKKNLFFDFY